MTYISAALGVPMSKVYGVATFYPFFTLEPQGEHTCVVCLGTACYFNGARGLLAAVRQSADIEPGETTADGKVSLLTARCLDAGSLAPAMVLDGAVLDEVSR
jgi:bidirectional [NiFe] hydrogenase diaphorase subunit